MARAKDMTLRLLFAGVALAVILFATRAMAADPVLHVDSQERFEASLAAMAEVITDEDAEALATRLVFLAAYELAPDVHPVHTIPMFADRPGALREALAPFEGMTAEQLLEASEGLGLWVGRQ